MTPDRWVVVELAEKDEKVQKVFCGNYGGYGGSDTWKLSSAIEEVIKHDKYIEFRNNSGSVYKCYYNSYGMSGYMHSVFQSLESKQTEDLTIKIVEEYEPTDEERKRAF